MSRMTKFLKQTCQHEKAQRDVNGQVVLNRYGDVQYEPPVTIKCRRERIIRDVQTSTGAILRSSTRYFTDETAPIEPDDRLDGQVILQVEEYTNQLGLTEGFESYV